MNKTKIHRFMITIISLAGIGLTVDSILEEWEIWVNPLMIAGVVVLWILHIGQYLTESGRETFYLAYTMFLTLFHGVHESSFFDVCPVVALVIVLFSLLDRMYALNLILAEYAMIMFIQYVFVVKPETIGLDDPIMVARLVLQSVIVVAVYIVCRMIIKSRLEQKKAMEIRDEEIEAYDNDIEDFLSNISHELRTPVNVVTGMSMLLQKNDSSEELTAVRDAGLRLSDQIEAIQDFTEVKRSSLILEEEEYMITSLVNDLVTDFRRYTGRTDLELVVDLAPSVPSLMKGDVKKIKKIISHLMDNAVKFTRRGGIYVKICIIPRKYGVNLCVEVTDTGIGMERRAISQAGAGMYQANKKRNRSTGGIGLGLSVIFGMAHRMGGFVKIESQKGSGTTVRVTVPQTVVDNSPCLKVNMEGKDIVFHVQAGKYKVAAVREFYRDMATNMATGLRLPLYSADSAKEVERLIGKLNVGYIFMGEEEYLKAAEYFDKLSKSNIVVAVSARSGFTANPGSRVIVMPKPLYGFPVAKLLNGDKLPGSDENDVRKPFFRNVKALIVDDEPMNLVVASGIFREYGMDTDTADSGKESISKFQKGDYDIIFMDHMMPEMDGVEAMKNIKDVARKMGRDVAIVALTANAVSGAREMFLREGFDGFIAKPIDLNQFERVMKRVLPQTKIFYKEEERA
ncbi:MAG: response regulator [Lachnospiraceae bacterium]|nr:response regulator [Lachnospiraceae bacterium]